MFHLNKRNLAKVTLAILGIGAICSATTLADDYMYVKAAHLNVRAAGTLKAKIIATVDTGYKVTILDASGKWKKVLLENGQVGYVNGGYLVAQEPSFKKVEASRYTIKSGTAFLRGFDLNKKAAVLNQGDVLEVTSEKLYLNRWIQVRVVDAKHPRYNGRIGYIAERLTSPLDNYVSEEKISEPQISEDKSTSDESIADPTVDMNSAPTTPAVVDTVTPAPEAPTTATVSAVSGTTTDSTDTDADIESLLKGL